MTANELINLIPSKVFRDLAVETKVDTQVKKLSGEVIFKLILFSMLGSEKLSLRVMETFLNSSQFKSFAHFDIIDGKYNSIRDRICGINADYFERLFQTIFSIYNKELKEEKALSRTDSTYVGLATKLLKKGMRNGYQDKHFVKYSINLKGSIPSSAKVFTEQAYVSEDLALAELINDSDCLKGNTVVFDRGLQSRKAFDKFTGNGKLFVSRANPKIKCENFTQNELPAKPNDSDLIITSDETGLLAARGGVKTIYKYRILKGLNEKSGEPLCFVTNIEDEDPYQIAEWYRQRWEIEVFFKFIKQHLNAKHLVSREPNGIKVMLYMTMILAILIIAYKKLNKIKGYKIAKLKFELELENSLIKEIVVLCGGDPKRAPHLFNSS